MPRTQPVGDYRLATPSPLFSREGRNSMESDAVTRLRLAKLRVSLHAAPKVARQVAGWSNEQIREIIPTLSDSQLAEVRQLARELSSSPRSCSPRALLSRWLERRRLRSGSWPSKKQVRRELDRLRTPLNKPPKLTAAGSAARTTSLDTNRGRISRGRSLADTR